MSDMGIAHESFTLVDRAAAAAVLNDTTAAVIDVPAVAASAPGIGVPGDAPIVVSAVAIAVPRFAIAVFSDSPSATLVRVPGELYKRRRQDDLGGRGDFDRPVRA
jgi:hypothetical protein